jgi:hypothetical protein
VVFDFGVASLREATPTLRMTGIEERSTLDDRLSDRVGRWDFDRGKIKT